MSVSRLVIVSLIIYNFLTYLPHTPPSTLTLMPPAIPTPAQKKALFRDGDLTLILREITFLRMLLMIC